MAAKTSQSPPHKPTRWRYVGHIPERIYANIPVTVRVGDVITWPEMPADDGCWIATTDPETRKPDNYRATEQIFPHTNDPPPIPPAAEPATEHQEG